MALPYLQIMTTNSTNQQLVEKEKKTLFANNVEKQKDRRPGKSIVIAITCRIYEIENEREEYRVESETKPGVFYIVKFVNKCPIWYSCKDWENRSIENPEQHLCRHIRAIPLAANLGLIKKSNATIVKQSVSWRDDDYGF